MNEIPKTDPELLKAIARESRDLLENRAFTTAIKVLRQQWFGELMVDGLPESRVLELRAKLQALEAIPARLNSQMHDPDFAERGNHARGHR